MVQVLSALRPILMIALPILGASAIIIVFTAGRDLPLWYRVLNIILGIVMVCAGGFWILANMH